MPYHQNSAGHGGRRCETERKTEFTLHGHHQERHKKECADGRQHSRSQELEIGSFQGDPLTWKSLQGEKVRSLQKHEINITVPKRVFSHLSAENDVKCDGMCVFTFTAYKLHNVHIA